eukprot:jgi/Ulvmu1/3024/UM015_0064.1
MSAAVRRIASAPHAAKACTGWMHAGGYRMIGTGPSNTEEIENYFNVLQVDRQATSKDVQAAFRQAARTCHPDLHRADPTAEQRFRRCLLAYQVLSDPKARRCHELALDTSAAPGLRKAAHTMAFRSRAAASYDLSFWEALSPSHWRAIASAEAALAPLAAASPAAPAALRLARELETSLHQVYYGPDISHVPAQHLPPAFEAEHRSHPLAADLLQLVSGRTLLGSVRCTQQATLPAAEPPGSPCSSTTYGSTSRAAEAAPTAACHAHSPDGGSAVDPCAQLTSGAAARHVRAPASTPLRWAAWGHAQLRALEASLKPGVDEGPSAEATPAAVPAARELVFSLSGEDQVRPACRP